MGRGAKLDVGVFFLLLIPHSVSGSLQVGTIWRDWATPLYTIVQIYMLEVDLRRRTMLTSCCLRCVRILDALETHYHIGIVRLFNNASYIFEMSHTSFYKMNEIDGEYLAVTFTSNEDRGNLWTT